MTTLILSSKDMTSLASMRMATKAVESAFAAHGRGEASMPPKVYLDLEDVGGDFRAMPARSGTYAGVKWVNSHPQNPQRHGLPTVLGTYILNDAATARPLAIMDGTLLTALRTGAAAGVASKYLAPKHPKTLGVVGCGAQASFIVEAHRVFWPDIDVLLFDRSMEAMERSVASFGATASSLEVVAASDIVCTGTPSREPVVYPNMLGTNVHINAMGADAEGKQELDAGILGASRVVIDDVAQAAHSGEINVPLHKGEFALDDVSAVLGEIVAGLKPGRLDDDGWTVFDSTGLAIQDLFLAAEIYQAALAADVGHSIDLVGC
jgi:alanine dehydrogenase